MEALFPLLCFSDSSCAVFKVRLKFLRPSGPRNLKTIQKPFQKLLEVSTQILYPTFAGSLPVFLRLCFSLKPFSFRTPLCLPFPSGSLRSFRPGSPKASPLSFLPRKEVIQPHLPIRLPCYDFTPVIGLTFDGCSLSVGSPASGAPNSPGVTGGVYKARERIHRGMLIRDY